MNIASKREIVGRFKEGESLRLLIMRHAYTLCKNEVHYMKLLESGDADIDVEQVLRDYMRGKFRLEKRRKA